MTTVDRICDTLTARLEAARERRAVFERVGADDAVRSMDAEVDLIKSIADEVLTIVVKASLPSSPVDEELVGRG